MNKSIEEVFNNIFTSLENIQTYFLEYMFISIVAEFIISGGPFAVVHNGIIMTYLVSSLVCKYQSAKLLIRQPLSHPKGEVTEKEVVKNKGWRFIFLFPGVRLLDFERQFLILSPAFQNTHTPKTMQKVVNSVVQKYNKKS